MAALHSQSVIAQFWNSTMPLCWLPNVTRFRTGGELQRSTYPRRNWPPWEKPIALTAGAVERMGWLARSEQTCSSCLFTSPKKVAVRSELGSGSRRML